MRICDLRQKEVIISCNCKRLGFVCDIEFDIATGKAHCHCGAGCGKICGLFGRDTEYVIPFHCIRQIGTGKLFWWKL